MWKGIKIAHIALGFTCSVYARIERARDCFKKTWGPGDKRYEEVGSFVLV